MTKDEKTLVKQFIDADCKALALRAKVERLRKRIRMQAQEDDLYDRPTARQSWEDYDSLVHVLEDRRDVAC